MLDNKRNLLFLLIFFLTSGFLGFNLYAFLTKPPPLSPITGKISSQNLPEKNFGNILSEATQAAQPQSQARLPAGQVAGVQIEGRVTIAILGDSMIDTMGDLKNLQLVLIQYYPKVELTLLNYGVGATKPADGLQRLTQSVTTPTKQLQPLLSVKPNIVVVESFAYNHGKNTQDEINNHYQTLKQLIDKLIASKIQVVFLVTIAPSQNYAKGAPNILWDENRQRLEAETVKSYLTAGVKFAQEQKLVLVNTFSPSLDASGFGKQIYVNSADNIHPSPEGIDLVSDLIAQKIAESEIVEKVLTP